MIKKSSALGDATPLNSNGGRWSVNQRIQLGKRSKAAQGSGNTNSVNTNSALLANAKPFKQNANGSTAGFLDIAEVEDDRRMFGMLKPLDTTGGQFGRQRYVYVSNDL
tara:strand:- start:1454 stop:1777 length:324 start_codon:yes stop_codon:yes gene_type:complete